MDSDINMKAYEFCLTHYLRALNDIVADDCRWLCIVIRLNRFISHRFVHSVWFHERAQQKKYEIIIISNAMRSISFARKSHFNQTLKKSWREIKKRRRWTEQICSGCWLVLLLIHLKLIAVDERNYLIAAKPILRTTAIYIEFNRCVCCLSNLRLFTFADLMWHNNTPSLVVLSFRGAAQKPFYIFSCIVRF